MDNVIVSSHRSLRSLGLLGPLICIKKLRSRYLVLKFLLTLRVKIRVIWGNEYLFGDIPQLGQPLNELGGIVVYHTYPPYKHSNNQLVSNT